MDYRITTCVDMIFLHGSTHGWPRFIVGSSEGLGQITDIVYCTCRFLTALVPTADWHWSCSCVTWLTARRIPKSKALDGGSARGSELSARTESGYTDGRMAFLSYCFTSTLTLTSHTAYWGWGTGGTAATHRRLVPSVRPVKTEETVSHRQNNDLRGPRRWEATWVLRNLPFQQLCGTESKDRVRRNSSATTWDDPSSYESLAAPPLLFISPGL